MSSPLPPARADAARRAPPRATRAQEHARRAPAADDAADDAAALAGAVDHGVFAAHVCVAWAANALWVACIWAKLEGRLGAGVRWSAVFGPTWAAHAVQLGVHAAALRNTVRACAHAAPCPLLLRSRR